MTRGEAVFAILVVMALLGILRELNRIRELLYRMSGRSAQESEDDFEN